MDKSEGVAVRMHHPEYRGVALTCDAPWEGNVCGYFSLIQDEGRYRLYYRGAQLDVDQDGVRLPSHRTYFCCAESADGKTFEKPAAGLVPFWGRTDNNILLDNVRDTIFFFRDSNPACPPEDRYKGLAEVDDALWYFRSADGLHFEKVRLLADDGAYDSLNVAFWDAATEQYFLFYRGLHGDAARDGKWNGTEERLMHTTVIRDVRVRTSKDFVSWSEPKMLVYGEGQEDYELYTNQVQPYYRAKHMFIGFPMRYVDRYQDAQNYPDLPDWKHRQKLIANWGRSGTAITDTILMTSRDGLHFRRTDEAFMTPGIERACNWYYGDGNLCYGMAETAGERPGAPNEISLYVGQDYRVHPIRLERYAVRLDGFFSWRCDFTPGRVVTRPLVFAGDRLSLNFATSAAGYVRLRLLRPDGTPLEGYDTGRLFGDSVDRAVDFSGRLAALAGREVRLAFTMKDADLYAFQFQTTPVIC